MVKVREDRPINADGLLNVEAWIHRVADIAGLREVDSKALTNACQLAQQLEKLPGDKLTGWGEGYTSFAAGLEMAEILAELQLDEESLAAALLYRSVRENKISLAAIIQQFGERVGSLIDGVRKMAAISNLTNHSGEKAIGQDAKEHGDNVRKMLVAMVDDVRVALIKLAERTSAIRAVKTAPIEKRQRIAREVADIYAPLAHRLGIGHIKWELEDVSFRYLQPYDYKYIAKLLDERRLDRQVYIDSVLAILEKALENEGIRLAEISGRAKHIYSIWRKMRRKEISFSEVYDIRAVRILVDTEQDCYRVLGVVHSLWHSIPNEFDDYIANPKENGYRSLHTAVKGPANRVLEVQIRTEKMHSESEFGVCAHWRYKNSDKSDTSAGYEQKIAWLREVLEWHDEIGGSSLEESLPTSIEQDRIYVFTPEGHVVDLPEHATPVDFAFRIHSDIGIHCKGAKVNGLIVPLNRALKNADQVEILTGNREAPSRDWLNSSMGYITTSRARTRLQAWFRAQDRDQNIDHGRALLDREFLRLAVDDIDYEKLARKLSLQTLDDLYAAVGTGDLTVERVIQSAQRLFSNKYQEPAISIVGRAKREDQADGSDVYIDGVGNLLSYIAQCCKPLPGESISGYITQGRGVSIHRQDCINLLQHSNEEPQKIIKVDWAEKPEQVYSVEIHIEAFDRHGLLRDITALLDRERVNVSALQTLSDKHRNTVDMTLHVEIASFTTLSRLFTRLSQMPNITSVKRRHSAR
ncbi:MAG: GTP diphosphokinase [Marinagarivorans sp.]|nr:GTP diphosphokinase [Marinagarivorans sp.]